MTQPSDSIRIEDGILYVVWEGDPGVFIDALDFYGIEVIPDPTGQTDFRLQLADMH